MYTSLSLSALIALSATGINAAAIYSRTPITTGGDSCASNAVPGLKLNGSIAQLTNNAPQQFCKTVAQKGTAKNVTSKFAIGGSSMHYGLQVTFQPQSSGEEDAIAEKRASCELNEALCETAVTGMMEDCLGTSNDIEKSSEILVNCGIISYTIAETMTNSSRVPAYNRKHV